MTRTRTAARDPSCVTTYLGTMKCGLNYLQFSIVNSLALLTALESHGLNEDASTLVTNETASEKCKPKDFLKNCLGQLPLILKNAERGLPASKEDVDSICKGFKVGMNCIQDYSKSCLTNEQKQKLENDVQGARHTFKFLCDDPGFKAEYLKYTVCLKGIRREWDDCTNRFIGLVKEELSRENNSTSRLVELCCARHGFVNCVAMSTRLKCRKEEIIFITKIADTLSNMRVYAPYCKQVNFALCSSASSTSGGRIFVIFVLFIFSKIPRYTLPTEYLGFFKNIF